MSNFIQSKIAPSTKFSIPPIQEEGVHELLADLDKHKMTGLDGVSAKLLRLASSVITRSITKILKTSINTGHFPTKWKLGWVTPIHKVGNKSEYNIFRPDTILCTLSNPLERHVHNSFYKFLQNNGLLYLAQLWFRALHSCETALSKIIDKWTSNTEKGLLNGVVLLDLRKVVLLDLRKVVLLDLRKVVLLDLRKAFDLDDTDVLLHKLSLFNCDDLTINWFKSYLQGREQCVIFKGNLTK